MTSSPSSLPSARWASAASEGLEALAEHGRRITLGGLDQVAVRKYLEAPTGELPAPATLGTIHQATGGNPFFLAQLSRLASTLQMHTSGESAPGLALPIPDTVRDAVRRRVALLSPPARDVLTVGSVLGPQFSLAALQRLCDRSLQEQLDALSEAADAGLLVEVGVTPHRYGFAHALVREALLAELPPSERVVWHRRAGVALEQLYAADLEPHLPELALHFAAAASADDTQKAIEYCVRAGHRAVRLLAYEEAVQQFQRALELTESGADHDAVLRCDLLLALGDAKLRASRALDAYEALARQLGHPLHLFYALSRRATAALAAGRFEEADGFISEAEDVGRRAHNPEVQIVVKVQQTFLAAERGRRDVVAGMLPWFAQWAKDFEVNFAPPTAMSAWLAVSCGRVLEGRQILERLTLQGLESLRGWSLDRPTSLALLTEVAVTVGNDALIAELHALLSPYSHWILAAGGAVWCAGSAARYLGQLSAALGRYDEAEAHYEAALSAHRRLGAPPWLARTQVDYAESLRARKQPGDNERAAELLTEAGAIAAEIGMVDLSAKVSSLQGEEQPRLAMSWPSTGPM